MMTPGEQAEQDQAIEGLRELMAAAGEDEVTFAAVLAEIALADE